ncbi:hypothetical protein [Catalinimonas niigatensis]|uniref:hypothetical protein n=1 Tax=Catalinimonas niigatensis TaxID=1397264 RepID=UPI002666C76C|nr:hypothetical protein [Catalinimonas niigatensis]WPP48001.1 hypothetical protein PZB72_15085 [Catalinimonas niigatensis]
MPSTQSVQKEGVKSSQMLFKRWAWISLFFLFIVAVLGVFLRSFYISPLPGLNYKFWLHGHSHVAFLGWIFNALYVALVAAYVRRERLLTFNRLFWAFQLTVLGMLILFPMQGYKAGSIIVSTLHIFLSYFFAWRFLKDRREETQSGGRFRFSFVIARFAIVLMLISSIGPFALAPIMANGLSGTHWYPLAIYFYLHFQYNGWFLFAIIGLFFYWLERNDIDYSKRDGRTFFWLNALAAIPAYASSVLWTQPPLWLYGLAGLAAFAQLFSLYFLFRILSVVRQQWINKLGKMVVLLWLLVLMSLVVKNILQFAEAIPLVADLAYRQRNLVIAYLHLNFIGITTFFLLGWFVQQDWLILSKFWQQTGMWVFIIGFILSELALVLQTLLNISGLRGFTQYFELLFYLSLIMPVGIGLLFISQQKKAFSESM